MAKDYTIWRRDYERKVVTHLGTVAASNAAEAIQKVLAKREPISYFGQYYACIRSKIGWEASIEDHREPIIKPGG